MQIWCVCTELQKGWSMQYKFFSSQSNHTSALFPHLFNWKLTFLMTPWRIKLPLKKYTVCDDWTKIVAQCWFGARIYPRALTLGSWPLNFRINFTFNFKYGLHAFLILGELELLEMDQMEPQTDTSGDEGSITVTKASIEGSQIWFFKEEI